MDENEVLTEGNEILPELTHEPIDEPQEEGDEKGITWEANHKKIVKAINESLRAYRATPPSVTELSRLTGLSRQTIYSHLKEYSTHPVHCQSTEMFDLMKFDVMMRLCSEALSGDMRAIRLYLQVVGMVKQQSGLVKKS